LALCARLLSVASRGGLGVRYLVLLPSLLLALLVALKGLALAYAGEASALAEVVGEPRLACSVTRPGGEGVVEVRLSYVDLGVRRALLVCVDDLERFLQLHDAELRGSPPGRGEALVGQELRRLLPGERVPLPGGPVLNISGTVVARDYLAYSIVITSDTADLLEVDWEAVVYEWEPGSSSPEAREALLAPSAAPLIGSVLSEVLVAASLISAVGYAMAGLACFFLASSSSEESEEVLSVFCSAGFTPRKLALALLALSAVLAGASTVLGLSLGVFTPALASALASIFAKLPYIRPVAYPSLGLDLALFFSTSALGFSAGFLRGLSRVVGNKGAGP